MPAAKPPDLLFVLTAGIWLALAISAHRLMARFKSCYPEVPARDIPYAQSGRHPEQFIYFFRASTQRLLRAARELFKVSRLVQIPTVLSIVVPSGGFALLVVVIRAIRQ